MVTFEHLRFMFPINLSHAQRAQLKLNSPTPNKSAIVEYFPEKGVFGRAYPAHTSVMRKLNRKFRVGHNTPPPKGFAHDKTKQNKMKHRTAPNSNAKHASNDLRTAERWRGDRGIRPGVDG